MLPLAARSPLIARLEPGAEPNRARREGACANAAMLLAPLPAAMARVPAPLTLAAA